jgi:hypothetical protein
VPYLDSSLAGLTTNNWNSGQASSALDLAGPGVAENQLRELPSLPSSATLFLSAMLSISGWHVLRSARHWHFGAVPEWYHTGGPLQVGHAVPLDLEFNALPLCCLELVDSDVGGQRPFLHRLWREFRARCDAQRLSLTVAAPRGPPFVSSI